MEDKKSSAVVTLAYDKNRLYDWMHLQTVMLKGTAVVLYDES